MDINNENLENALQGNKAPQVSKDTEIGFHQGALETLAGERHALVDMVQHVEARMQAHSKRLQEMGVNTENKQ